MEIQASIEPRSNLNRRRHQVLEMMVVHLKHRIRDKFNRIEVIPEKVSSLVDSLILF